MNKKELIASVAKAANLEQSKTRRVLDELLERITEALESGKPVTLVNFGSFKVQSRAPRTGRNPRTGEMVAIPGAQTAKFTAGKGLKQRVNA